MFRVLSLLSVLLLSASPAALQDVTGNGACPAGTTLTCSIEGCLCLCPNGRPDVASNGVCPAPTPPPLPPVQITPVQPSGTANGLAVQTVPGISPRGNVREPRLRPPPPAPGGPVSSTTPRVNPQPH